MNKKKIKPTLRRILVKRLDVLFSIFIRRRDAKARGYCPFHAGNSHPIQCCFHFVTRSKHSLRWDERNAVASCNPCNYRYEFDPHFAIQWYIRTYGQAAYDRLIQDGNVIAKFSADDLRLKLESLKEKLETQ